MQFMYGCRMNGPCSILLLSKAGPMFTDWVALVLTPEQRLAFIEVETAHANYTRVMSR